MKEIMGFLSVLNDIVWGPPMIALIIGTGLFLQARLKFMPIFRIGSGFAMIWKSRKPDEGAKGEITPFAALMTALAATIGTGNIVGVATAISIGGPGALFWMWITAFVGMATKYAEVLLSVHFRETDAKGEQIGGPMFAIKNGLGSRWRWLGAVFAIFGGLAGVGIGNMVQSNGIADILKITFGVEPVVSGSLMMAFTGLVLVGGVKRIGAVAQALVPFMCVAYVSVSLFALFTHLDRIPSAIMSIFNHAFSPVAATGGFSGATVMLAMRYGVARGIFSNEAGLGTAGIAQAAGKTKSSVESGLVGMMGVFIDTIIVCSMTGLVLVVTDAWSSGLNGSAMVAYAFESILPGFGQYVLAISLTLFAYTTILGWAYYGEKCWEYLLGVSVEKIYRILWTALVMAGALTHLDFVWLVSDILNALMALPNLISLLFLSPVVVELTRNYFNQDK